MIGEPLEAEEVNESLADEDVQITLDYLLTHKMEFTQQFLRKRSLPFSGTKEILRERLEGYLLLGDVTGEDLVELLNKIEGWGNQHAYLYRAPDSDIEPWLTEETTRTRLNDLGLIELLNRTQPLVLPDERTLFSVEWNSERLRFLWLEKRQWEERVPEEDIEQRDLVWRAYRPRTARGITAFDWDLVSGHAMLLIQRLPRGTQYEHLRDQFEDELEPIIGIQRFQRVLISRAIQLIEESGEARRRQLAYETLRGGKATFLSANRATDTNSDPALERAGRALGGDKAGWLGNFYWLQVPRLLERELHIKLYAADQRVGIFGERREAEVRYVISRIRHYSN